MATIKYLLQSDKDNANIYMRLSLSQNKSIKRKTGLIINSKNWSKKTAYPIAKDESLKKLKSDLLKLETHILDSYNNATTKGIEINGDWLVKSTNLFFNKIDDTNNLNYASNIIDYLIQIAPTRKNAKGSIGLSQGRIKAYKNLKNILQKFQDGKPLLIKNIDLKFANDFKEWMLIDQKYSSFYMLKKISDLKFICKTADSLDIETNKSFSLMKVGRTKIENIIFLTPEELKKISDHTFASKALNNAKKWLLLGCEIGQRVDDLLSITEKNISYFKANNKIRVITLIQGKGDKKVTIPLNPIAENIIKDGLPYKIAKPNFNKYIKEVCKDAGIDNIIPGGKMIDKRMVQGKYPKYQLVTSHICRRSFATNYYSKMPTSILKSLTGHSTEQMLLTYIGKTSIDYTEQAYYAMLETNKTTTNL